MSATKNDHASSAMSATTASAPTNGKKVKSKSDKSGLVLPVTRVHSRMKKAMGKGGRVAAKSPVYMTAVLEYLAVEVLESAGKITEAAKRKRITPADLVAGIRGDPDLARVFANVEVVVGSTLTGVTEACKYTHEEAEGNDEE
tara:strand:- start:96 stop:524 length:429 start_codon:yes stop_codon:yes gene_type:complete